ncbi:MAG: glycosyltransferase [Candidatus Electrothrix sp. AR3]|nr:glycosyltransferase [Candidatus Electrothrix sp. AR3]
MKIIFVHTSLSVGGAEVLRNTVARELLALKMDFRICLLSSEGVLGKKLREAGANVDVLKISNSIYKWRSTLALKKYLEYQQPDIVQSSQFNSNFHTRIAAKLAGVPVVICEEHGLYYWKRWWHRLADRLLIRWCDQIIAVSEAVKDFNINQIGISAEKKIEVLLNCIDTDQFQSVQQGERNRVRHALGVAENDFIFGHVGTLRHEKGHDILLHAFAALRKRDNAKLLLVGDGPLRSQLLALSRELNLVSDVIFCGSRNDISAILSAMDCFVFPSRNEALGIALLEAMYSGLPVIAADTGGIPEIVTNRETGILVSCENSALLAAVMDELYRNDTLRLQLGYTSKKYVAQYHNPVCYVERLLALYDQLSCKKKSTK